MWDTLYYKTFVTISYIFYLGSQDYKTLHTSVSVVIKLIITLDIDFYDVSKRFVARFSAINLIFTIHLGLASTRQVYARDVINIIIIPVVLNIICVEYFNYYALRPRGILM